MMDSSVLQEGTDYEKLKESYVIFICLDDPFGKGKPIYTVEQKFKETEDFFNDKTHKVFYNVSAFADADDAEIQGFLKYVNTGDAETDFARELMEAVDFAKIDAYAWNRYMAERLHDSDIRKEGIQQGIAQGEHKKAIETARALLSLGVNTVEQIAQATGLSLAEVQELES